MVNRVKDFRYVYKIPYCIFSTLKRFLNSTRIMHDHLNGPFGNQIVLDKSTLVLL